MKHKFLVVVLSLLASLCFAFGLASCGEGGSNRLPTEGLEFELNSDEESFSVVGIGTATDTDIVIPARHDGLPVTAIGASAFYECYQLTSILIPDSVTSIGDSAFYNSGLASMTIPDSVTLIGNYAFYGNAFTGITIPDSVTFIGEHAFSFCTYMMNITIGKGIASIEAHTFTRCDSLKNVTIPDNVISIGESAFSSCKNLTDIILGSRVASIGERAFDACEKLASITIPDSVTSIGPSAFMECRELTSVTISNRVTSIEPHTFAYCYKLTNIVLPASVKKIGGGAFEQCLRMKSISIPNSVTSIGANAFFGCSGLTDVHIEDMSAWCRISFGNSDSNPLSYAQNLYLDGARVTNLTIPNGVTSIGNYAFYGHSGFTSVTISDSVTSIGRTAFSSSGLTSVKISDSVATIGDGAFMECTELANVIWGNGVKEIGASAFYNCSNLTGDLKIPDSVTSIGNYAFGHCSGLTSVTIGKGVITIDSSAFYACSELTEVQWNANSVTLGSSSRGRALFGDCPKLKSVVYGDTVTSLTAYALYDCAATDVVIPNSVTYIGDSAFYNCSGLVSLTFRGTTDAWKAIKKHFSWRQNSSIVSVVCTNGTLTGDSIG